MAENLVEGRQRSLVERRRSLVKRRRRIVKRRIVKRRMVKRRRVNRLKGITATGYLKEEVGSVVMIIKTQVGH